MTAILAMRAMSDDRRTRVLSAFREQNPGPEAIYSVEGLEVIVTGQGSSPNSMTFENGAFIGIAGVPVYRRRIAHSATRALLHDLVANKVEEAEVGGAFAAIVWDGRRALFFTDWLGNMCAYRNEDRTVWSTSFLAVAASCRKLSLDAQGAWEYIFQGAPCGESTALAQVHRINPEKWHDPLSGGELERQNLLPREDFQPRRFDDLVERAVHSLDGIFDTICNEYQDRIDTALSGGYDSRLILAALRSRGVTPRIHVYGHAGDSDVQIAKAIAASEGLAIEHTDKSSIKQSLDEDRLVETVTRNFVAFDGLPPDGIFERGADLVTRQNRMASGHLALNGGGGEVFRNFFYLLDRPYTLNDFMGTFYSRFDTKVCSDAFAPRTYLQTLTNKVLAALRVEADDFRRADIERAYPLFRCRFWMAHNTSINNIIGHAITPLVHIPAIVEALRVPIRYKSHGRLEAAMIYKLDPRLAQYRSNYRRSMVGEETAPERLRDYATLLRPVWLRRAAYQIRQRIPSSNVYAEWMKIFGMPDLLEWSTIRALVIPERMRDEGTLNRTATLQVLCTRLGVDEVDPAPESVTSHESAH